jgi:hypothetical protein
MDGLGGLVFIGLLVAGFLFVNVYAFHRWGLPRGREILLIIPDNAPFLALIAYHLYLRRAHRRITRRKHGQCVVCGYDLRGSTQGRCSECGTRIWE